MTDDTTQVLVKTDFGPVFAEIDRHGAQVAIAGSNRVVIAVPLGRTGAFSELKLPPGEEKLFIEISPANNALRITFHTSCSRAVRDQPLKGLEAVPHPTVLVEPAGTKEAPALKFQVQVNGAGATANRHEIVTVPIKPK